MIDILAFDGSLTQLPGLLRTSTIPGFTVLNLLRRVFVFGIVAIIAAHNMSSNER
jgi:hypothetical protein